MMMNRERFQDRGLVGLFDSLVQLRQEILAKIVRLPTNHDIWPVTSLYEISKFEAISSQVLPAGIRNPDRD